MEKKDLELYTEEERQELLRHWWSYYGKMLITLEENDQFLKLVEKDSKMMMDAALVSYAGGVSSQFLILAMRNGALDSYLKMVSEIANSDTYKSDRKMIEASFIDLIVDSYNNPEPAVPFTLDQIVEQLIDIYASTNSEDKSEDRDEEKRDGIKCDVSNLYDDCLLRDDEIKENAPTVNFVVGDGVLTAVAFSAERLNKNRDGISQIFDSLLKTDQPVGIFDVGRCENGSYWAETFSEVDKLLQLGFATGIIEFSKPRSEWEDDVPSVIRCKENCKAAQLVKKPCEYQQVVEELKKEGAYLNKNC